MCNQGKSGEGTGKELSNSQKFLKLLKINAKEKKFKAAREKIELFAEEQI